MPEPIVSHHGDARSDVARIDQGIGRIPIMDV